MTRLIDIHSHAVFASGLGAPGGVKPPPGLWSVEAAIAFMDAHDIQACVLSLPDAANGDSGAAARTTARLINEALAEIVAKHPERFGALATLPGRDPGGALEEIEYALDVLGLDGVSTATSIGDVYLGDPEFDPWFEELDRRGATLFIHPTLPATAGSTMLGLHPSVIEFMFQTTRMLTNMVLVTGAKQRFSAIDMIVAHAGGTIPFIVRRIETVFRGRPPVADARLELSPEQVREGFASFYYDLTAAASSTQISAVLDLVPPTQVLMGLDFPAMPPSSFAPAIAQVQRCERLDAAQLSDVVSGNALRLLPTLAARLAD